MKKFGNVVIMTERERRAPIEKVIKAIMWYFGCSRRIACKYLGENSRATIDEIVRCFDANAKSAFYND